MTWSRSTAIAAVLLPVLAVGCRSLPPGPAPPRPDAVADCPHAAPDRDQDGLSDACELQLATAFAPVLVTSSTACNMNADADGRRLGGGYLFVVRPTPAGAVIGYLPAYFQDCGWSGPKCLLPGLSCAPHAGDSELIALDLRREGRSWRVEGVFLSAHCFGRSSPGCRWYRGEDLRQFEWGTEGAAVGPVVWVADGRNANYPSRRACERGHGFVDTCGGSRLRYPFPVHASRNIGSRVRPLETSGARAGCVRSAPVDPGNGATAPDAVECFWDPDARFRGWQASGDGVTPYERYLREVIGI